MCLKININKIMMMYTFFLGISIVVRCKPEIIYINGLIEYAIILLFTFLSLCLYLINKKKIKIYWFELLIIITPLFFITNNGVSKYIIFTCIGIVYYLIIQKKYECLKALEYPILIFALITALVSWIAVIWPNIYVNNILKVFDEASSLRYSFINRGMNHGFTNHYSRNAFYVAIGIFVLASKLISNNCKYKKLSYFIMIFLMGTELLVAKRGTTIFLLISVLFVLLLKQKSVYQKITKTIKYVIIALVVFGVLLVFVPQIGNFIKRFTETMNSDDISTGRFYLYEVAWQMFLKNPILGNGWNSFIQSPEILGTTFQAVHNDYIQLLAELGIVGEIVFIIPNICIMYFSIKTLRYIYIYEVSSIKEKNIITFSTMIQMFFILYSLTGYPHFSYEQMLLYLMVSGASIGISKYYYLNKTKNRREK